MRLLIVLLVALMCLISFTSSVRASEVEVDAEGEVEAEVEAEAEAEVDAEGEVQMESPFEHGTFKHLRVDDLQRQSPRFKQLLSEPRNAGLATIKDTAHYATLDIQSTWAQANDYCRRQGYRLCNFKELCPEGEGQPPVGANELPDLFVFAPIRGPKSARDNAYAALTEGAGDGVCTRKNNPDFATARANPPKKTTKSLVACCSTKSAQAKGVSAGVQKTIRISNDAADKFFNRSSRRARRAERRRKRREARKKREAEEAERKRREVKDGSTKEQAAKSCRAIRDLNSSKFTKDGVFWIDLPKAGVTQVFCLMNPQVDGGGWMLALKTSRSGATFQFDSHHWTDAGSTLNPDSLNRDANDAKFAVFNVFPAQHILGLWPDIGRVGGSLQLNDYGAWSWLVHNFDQGRQTSLVEFFRNRQNHHISHPHHFKGWNDHGHPFSGQGCHAWFGFNYLHNHHNRVRWGFGWNNECDAGSNDVTGGIGLSRGLHWSAGDHIGCCQSHTGQNRQMAAQIYVR